MPPSRYRELTDGLLLPGFVDTHVHFPQARIIGDLGMPLLDWLERCALPEEARFADLGYAQEVAAEFVSGLADAGTTTALVFGAHFAPAVDALFAAASARGLRITSGLVVSDRLLRPELHTTPQRAYDEGLALANRWHGQGLNRYAVIPRFALSCTDDLLASCAALHAAVPGSWLTSHVNENTGRDRHRRATCSGAATSTATTGTAWSGRGPCSRTTSTPPTDELERPGHRRRSGRALPYEQRRAGQRAVPAGPSPRASACRWHSAAMSAPAPAIRCSRRGCRRTSCSSCVALTACR